MLRKNQRKMKAIRRMKHLEIAKERSLTNRLIDNHLEIVRIDQLTTICKLFVLMIYLDIEEFHFIYPLWY